MKNILDFNKYNFIMENFDMSYGDMFQSNLLSSHLGSQIGLPYDARTSNANGGLDSTYANNFKRNNVLVGELVNKISNSGVFGTQMKSVQQDNFVEDVNKFTSLKILRTIENNNNKLDVYISFVFEGEDYFGVYKDFDNTNKKSKLVSEFFTSGYEYLNNDYILKLDNFLYNIIENWFIPEKGFYRNLKEGNPILDNFGKQVPLRKNTEIKVLGYEVDVDNNKIIICEHKKETYKIKGKDYYFFNYYFEKK